MIIISNLVTPWQSNLYLQSFAIYFFLLVESCTNIKESEKIKGKKKSCMIENESKIHDIIPKKLKSELDFGKN